MTNPIHQLADANHQVTMAMQKTIDDAPNQSEQSILQNDAVASGSEDGTRHHSMSNTVGRTLGHMSAASSFDQSACR